MKLEEDPFNILNLIDSYEPGQPLWSPGRRPDLSILFFDMFNGNMFKKGDK